MDSPGCDAVHRRVHRCANIELLHRYGITERWVVADYLIAADLPGNPMAGSQEIYNIISKEGLKNLLYMGVHENMCISKLLLFSLN